GKVREQVSTGSGSDRLNLSLILTFAVDRYPVATAPGTDSTTPGNYTLPSITHLILFTPSCKRSSEVAYEIRMKPSAPKPSPSVTTVCSFSNSSFTNSADVLSFPFKQPRTSGKA